MIKCKRQKTKKTSLKESSLDGRRLPPSAPPQKSKNNEANQTRKKTQESMRQQNTFRFKTRGIKEKTPKRVSTLNSHAHTHRAELHTTTPLPDPAILPLGTSLIPSNHQECGEARTPHRCTIADVTNHPQPPPSPYKGERATHACTQPGSRVPKRLRTAIRRLLPLALRKKKQKNTIIMSKSRYKKKSNALFQEKSQGDHEESL